MKSSSAIIFATRHHSIARQNDYVKRVDIRLEIVSVCERPIHTALIQRPNELLHSFVRFSKVYDVVVITFPYGIIANR